MADKIVLAGNIIVDNVKTITAWPEKGMLVPITALKRSPGGAVPNSGIDLKKLDPAVEVSAVAKSFPAQIQMPYILPNLRPQFKRHLDLRDTP